MIRSLLIVILIVAFLILSIPILLSGSSESSTLTPVIFLHCVLFSLCLN